MWFVGAEIWRLVASKQRKREVRNRWGFGDLLGTFQSIEKYLASEREIPSRAAAQNPVRFAAEKQRH